LHSKSACGSSASTLSKPVDAPILHAAPIPPD
jgi:hypothetical protein